MLEIFRFLEPGEIDYVNRVNPSLIGINISDLHFGVMNPEYQYNILKTQQIDRLYSIHFDYFAINGDLFDHKFSTTSDAVMYALKYIDEVVKLCRYKNATLIMIKGTEFHDAGQLKLFYYLLSDNTIDVRIIEQTKFEFVKGSKILCIPEEYNKGADYYNYFLNQEYDFCLMHGVIKGAIYGHSKEDLDSTKSPIFSIDSFINSRGPIISGHVHVSGCYNTYFYYCGSPYHWCFGEEQDKGYLIVLHDLLTGAHYVDFQKLESHRYLILNISTILNGDPQEIINLVQQHQNTGIDFIRLDYSGNPNSDQIAMLELLKNYYRNNISVKIKFEIEQEKSFNKTADMTKYEQYSYLNDKNMTDEDKLVMYINQKKGFEFITVTELVEILNER